MVQSVVPLGVGIALSPAVILAAIMILLSARPRAASAGLLLGWAAGIVLTATLFAVLASTVWAVDPAAAERIEGVIAIVIGAVLLVLAVVQWRRRPRPGQPVALPRWLAVVETLDARRAAALGFALLVINPKNLVLAIAAGAASGSAVSGAGVALSVAVFALVAVSTVAVPVGGYAVLGGRLSEPLSRLRGWLVRHSAVFVLVVLLVLGAGMIVSGIQAL